MVGSPIQFFQYNETVKLQYCQIVLNMFLILDHRKYIVLIQNNDPHSYFRALSESWNILCSYDTLHVCQGIPN